MTIGQTIKQYRTEQNLSQSDLGEKLGVSHMAISYWENGRNTPSLEHTAKIAEVILTNGEIDLLRDIVFRALHASKEDKEKILSVTDVITR